MKRCVLRIIGFAAAGAAVNTGVAWWFAAFWPGGFAMTQGGRAIPNGWAELAPAHWPRHADGFLVSDSVGRNAGAQERHMTLAPERLDPRDGSAVTYLVAQTRFGWPFRSMETVQWQSIKSSPSGGGRMAATPVDVGERGVIDLSPAFKSVGLRASGRLPVRALWPGFVANSIIFGVVLWLSVDSTRWIRTAARRRTGRCVRCGYDLRGDHAAGCPECGWNRGGPTSGQVSATGKS